MTVSARRITGLVVTLSLLLGISLAAPNALARTPQNAGATSSSQANSSLAPGNGTDGNIFTFFSSAAHTAASATEWLQIDLGWVQGGITGVKLYPRTSGYGFPQDFQIQVSTDGSSYSTVLSFTAYPNPGDNLQHFFFAPQSARYIRLYATKLSLDDSGINYYLQMAEMQADQQLLTVYSRNAATASSSLSGWAPTNAIDGQPGTAYSSNVHSSAANTEWLQLDLGSSQSVNRVRLYPRSGGYGFPVTFELQGSTDGVTFAGLPGQSYISYPNPGNAEQFFYFPATTVRYVRLYATQLGADQYNNYYLQLAEINADNIGSDRRLAPSSVSASSTNSQPGMGPTSAADEQPGTFWSTPPRTSANTTEWLSESFNHRYAFDSLTLVPRPGGYGFPVDFQIQYSNDNTNWTTLVSETGYPNPGGTPQTFSFRAVEAQYLRVQATKLSTDGTSNYYFQLVEMEANVGYPFTSDIGGDYDRQVNAMWTEFGSIKDGTSTNVTFGNEPTYMEWMARKYMWARDSDLRSSLESKVRDFPEDTNGYVWSWGSQRAWPSGNVMHYDNNPKYIMAVWRIVLWDGSSFLNQTDQNTSSPSYGLTVWQKVQNAMSYMQTNNNANNGLFIVGDTNNNGTRTGAPSNYWDNLRFGYKEGSTAAYFYGSLLAMRDLWYLKGSPSTGDTYASLATTTQTNFNNTFWNATTGRYAGTIDSGNNSWDLGFTFANTEAMSYGLANSSKARTIYDWLDGLRIVSGETSTGADIYRYRIAPRSETVKVETTISGSNSWWMDPGCCPLSGSGSWDQHLENGGIIFYTAFYDVLARARLLSANNAFTRFNAIVREYGADELRRNPANAYGNTWKFGVGSAPGGSNNSFPESGLVPAAPLYAFMGVDASYYGLDAFPNLPPSMTTMSVQQLTYQGNQYNLQVWNKKVQITSLSGSSGTLSGRLGNLTPNANYTLTNLDTGTGTTTTTSLTADANGIVAYTNQTITGSHVLTIQ